MGKDMVNMTKVNMNMINQTLMIFLLNVLKKILVTIIYNLFIVLIFEEL